MRLICERCAAVAVDYQERLLPPIRGRERLMKKSAELLEGLSLLSVPVLFTEQYPQGLGKTDPALLALAPGAPVFLTHMARTLHKTQAEIEARLAPPLIACFDGMTAEV